MIETDRPPTACPCRAAPPLVLALAPLLAAAGCGGPGPGDIVATDPLGYSVPDPNPVSYTFGDTAEFVIETGAMGSLQVRNAQEGLAVLEFMESDDGLRVSVSFPRLRATFATSAQGEEEADESALGGPVVVTVEPSGRATVVDTPSLGPGLAAMTGPDALVRPLFVHLPARAVEPGASWVDTLETREETGGTRSVGRSIITTTLVGDSVVDGRVVLLLRTHSSNTVEMSGVSGGVEVEQQLAGTTRGTVLWDPRVALLVERVEEGELSGSLRMSGTTVQALPVAGTVRRVIRLEW